MLVMVVFFIAFRWIHLSTPLIRLFLLVLILLLMPTLKDRKSGSAGMPRPISYAVFCLKKKKGVKHNFNRCSICEERHVFFRHDPRDNAFISMAHGHLFDYD